MEFDKCHIGVGQGVECVKNDLAIAIKKIPIQLICNEARLNKFNTDHITDVASRKDYIIEKNYCEFFDNAGELNKVNSILENSDEREKERISSKGSCNVNESSGENKSNKSIRPYNWGNLDKFDIWSSVPNEHPQVGMSSGDGTLKVKGVGKLRTQLENVKHIWDNGTSAPNSRSQENEHCKNENYEPKCNPSAEEQDSSIFDLRIERPDSTLPNSRYTYSNGNYSATTNYNSVRYEMAQSLHYVKQVYAAPIVYAMQPMQVYYNYGFFVSEFPIYYGNYYYSPYVTSTFNETVVNTSVRYQARYPTNGNGAIMYSKQSVQQSRTSSIIQTV